MKKILLSLLMCLAGSGLANAQYDYSSASRLDSIENALALANSRLAILRADSIHDAVWRTGRYFNVGYSIASTSSDVYNAEKAKFGVFISKGTSYLWPRKSPIGGMLKLGFDVRWFDMQFAMYDKFARKVVSEGNFNGVNNYSGWTSDMTASSDNGGGASAKYPNYATFNHMSLLVGAFGIGPTLTVAPLTFMDNAVASLRLNLYFHYQPTFGLNLYTAKCVYAGNGVNPIDGTELPECESEVLPEYGYANMFDWGFKIQWRTFGLGFETRWGSGKLTNSSYSPYCWGENTFYGKTINMNGADDIEGSYTRKFSESRIYLDFVF